jgi:Flp pilus assembly protein TadD
MVSLAFDDPAARRRFWVNLFLDVTEEPDDEVVESIRATRPIDELLDALKADDPIVRTRTTQMLWALWMGEAGQLAQHELARGMRLLEQGDWDPAVDCFTRLIESAPTFSEARNKRATAHFLQGNYAEAVTDCRAALELNPRHFGAWHGLGLCYIRLGDFSRACTAFRSALSIQPLAEENTRLLAYCRGRCDGATKVPSFAGPARRAHGS